MNNFKDFECPYCGFPHEVKDYFAEGVIYENIYCVDCGKKFGVSPLHDIFFTEKLEEE